MVRKETVPLRPLVSFTIRYKMPHSRIRWRRSRSHCPTATNSAKLSKAMASFKLQSPDADYNAGGLGKINACFLDAGG